LFNEFPHSLRELASTDKRNYQNRHILVELGTLQVLELPSKLIKESRGKRQMSNVLPMRPLCKGGNDGSKTSVEDILFSYLSVESAFSNALNSIGSDREVLDDHLLGIYFSIVEGNYTILDNNVIQILDFGRFFKAIAKSNLPKLKKVYYRRCCKRQDGQQLLQFANHPKFKECFRFKIGNKLVGHLLNMNSVHALYLAFAVNLTSKLFTVSLAHSLRTSSGFQQKATCPLTILFLHYRKSLLGLTKEKDVVKRIKVSLCTEFSIQANQDLPEGSKDSFRIFPEAIRNYINVRFESRPEKLQFYFNILQSKALCREVSTDLINETLEKHKKTLCDSETRTLEPEFLQELKRQGRKMGLFLRDHYDPTKTIKAPTTASFSYNRRKDGVLGELRDRSMVHYRKGVEQDGLDRMEPLVIGLFGPPASGKTTTVQRLIADLQRDLFPDVNLNDVSYSRSCSMKHWDGYQNQPITVLDDFGQSSDRLDVIEFQQLVSCNAYRLPMADLSDKGMNFNSPIIIITSNMEFGATLSTTAAPHPIEDNLSFWRRIHLPIFLSKDRNDRVIASEALSHLLSSEEKENFEPNPRATAFAMSQKTRFLIPQFSPKISDSIDLKNFGMRDAGRQTSSIEVFSTARWGRQQIRGLVKRLSLNHFEHHLRSTSKFWNQSVCTELLTRTELDSGVILEQENPLVGESHTVEYRFPRSPPDGPLPVRVEPIPEPLKVRIITAGKAETRCLKPLQRCMHDYLGTQRQFRLTHGTKFLERSVWNCRETDHQDPKLQECLSELNALEGDDFVWVSGDYESATDNFILESGKVILTEALEFIDHEPTRLWALKEMSSHLLVYPKTSGISPGIQRNGQLMGSLLSFPLLCLVNDATAVLAGAGSDSYLINGDDIIMRVPKEVETKWRAIAPKLGLSLSIGKTFSDPDFGTVNSQLFWKGTLLKSGKQRVASRRANVLGECYRDYQRFFSDSDKSNILDLRKIFLQLNRPALSRTFESLDVPVSHGGLGLISIESKSDFATRNLLVYYHKLRKKLYPTSGVLKLPFVGMEDLWRKSRLDSTLEIPSQSEIHEGVTGRDVQLASKEVGRHPHLRELLSSISDGETSLLDLPDLSFITIREVPYSGTDWKEKQFSIANRFFNLFCLENLKNPDVVELLQRFKVMKEKMEIKALGLLKNSPEVPSSVFYSDTCLPDFLVCEQLWSDILLCTSHLGAIPERSVPLPGDLFERCIPEVLDSQLDHIVDYSSVDSITSYDVPPQKFEVLPEDSFIEPSGMISELDFEINSI
jgi:hypothetical protein